MFVLDREPADKGLVGQIHPKTCFCKAQRWELGFHICVEKKKSKRKKKKEKKKNTHKNMWQKPYGPQI